MDSLEPKKLALLRILQILWEESDCDHPLHQGQIVKLLDEKYKIVVERKAIGRNLSLLQEAGFEIESNGGGFYLNSRLFEDSELQLLIDGVLASRHISVPHSKELIEKICSLSNRYFPRHIGNIHSVGEWNKTDNKTLFYHIELVDEAIENGKMITYEYNKYGLDKKLHKTSFQRISPYSLILHNQRYYLMGYSDYWDHMVYHRMDRITNMTVSELAAVPIRKVKGFEGGVNYRDISTLPYMYAEKPERVTFRTTAGLMDQIVDWFGKDVTVRKCEDDKIEVSIHAAPTAMLYWALQYADYVEVISPATLRERIAAVVGKANEVYKGE